MFLQHLSPKKTCPLTSNGAYYIRTWLPNSKIVFHKAHTERRLFINMFYSSVWTLFSGFKMSSSETQVFLSSFPSHPAQHLWPTISTAGPTCWSPSSPLSSMPPATKANQGSSPFLIARKQPHHGEKPMLSMRSAVNSCSRSSNDAHTGHMSRAPPCS